MHIPKSAEQVFLSLPSGSVIAFERMQGGNVQVGVAEYKRPQYLVGDSNPQLPISKFYYADLRLGEVTLEKAFAIAPNFTSEKVTYTAEDLAALKDALNNAYNQRSSDPGQLPSLIRMVRKSGMSTTIQINYPVQLMHWDFQDANIEGEELVMLRVAAQPVNFTLYYMEGGEFKDFDMSRYVSLP